MAPSTPMTTSELLKVIQNVVDSEMEKQKTLPVDDSATDDAQISDSGWTVNLSYRNISILPEEAMQIICSGVARLALSHNQLASFPYNLSLCTQLRYLNARHNAMREFPSAVLNLPWLEILDLSSNNITVLPEEIEQLRGLKLLSVSHNQIERLPLSLARMESLMVLNAQGNPLTFPSASKLQPSVEDENLSQREKDLAVTSRIKDYMKGLAMGKKRRLDSATTPHSLQTTDTQRANRRTLGGRFPVRPSISHSASTSSMSEQETSSGNSNEATMVNTSPQPPSSRSVSRSESRSGSRLEPHSDNRFRKKQTGNSLAEIPTSNTGSRSQGENNLAPSTSRLRPPGKNPKLEEYERLVHMRQTSEEEAELVTGHKNVLSQASLLSQPPDDMADELPIQGTPRDFGVEFNNNALPQPPSSMVLAMFSYADAYDKTVRDVGRIHEELRMEFDRAAPAFLAGDGRAIISDYFSQSFEADVQLSESRQNFSSYQDRADRISLDPRKAHAAIGRLIWDCAIYLQTLAGIVNDVRTIAAEFSAKVSEEDLHYITSIRHRMQWAQDEIRRTIQQLQRRIERLDRKSKASRPSLAATDRTVTPTQNEPYPSSVRLNNIAAKHTSDITVIHSPSPIDLDAADPAYNLAAQNYSPTRDRAFDLTHPPTARAASAFGNYDTDIFSDDRDAEILYNAIISTLQIYHDVCPSLAPLFKQEFEFFSADSVPALRSRLTKREERIMTLLHDMHTASSDAAYHAADVAPQTQRFADFRAYQPLWDAVAALIGATMDLGAEMVRVSTALPDEKGWSRPSREAIRLLIRTTEESGSLLSDVLGWDLLVPHTEYDETDVRS